MCKGQKHDTHVSKNHPKLMKITSPSHRNCIHCALAILRTEFQSVALKRRAAQSRFIARTSLKTELYIVGSLAAQF